jgi:O-antigen/teichoic acid export membrane protein
MRTGPRQLAIAGSLATALASQAALVVSGIAVARLLGPENRGFLALIILIPTIVTQLVGLGISAALPYFIAREPGAAGAVGRAIVRPTVAQAAIGVAVHAVAALLLLGGEADPVRLAAAISLLIVPGALAQELAIAVLQGLHRFREYNLLRLLPVVAYAAGVALLFVTGIGDLVLITAVSVASTVGFAILSVAVVRRGVGGAPGRARFRPILDYGLRGYLGANTIVETYRLDQVLIGLLMSPAALGYYVIGLAFTNLPKFIAQSVGIVAYPHIAAQASGASGRAALWRYLGLVAALSGATVLVFGALADWVVVLFFGAEFAPAVPVTRLLLLNAFLFSLRRLLTDGARGLGLSGRGSIAEVASVVVFAVAFAVIGVDGGIEGVAIALAISSAVAVALLLVLVARGRPDSSDIADASPSTDDPAIPGDAAG